MRRSLGHSEGRRLGSKDRLAPLPRMRRISSWDSSQALAESAGGMPVACRWRAPSISSRIWARPSRLAAEPRRKYSTRGSAPSTSRDFIWNPVGACASTSTKRQSRPSRVRLSSTKRPSESSPTRLQPGHREAEAGEADGDVAVGAGDAFAELLDPVQFAGLFGDEHGHGLAEAEDLEVSHAGVPPGAGRGGRGRRCAGG